MSPEEETNLADHIVDVLNRIHTADPNVFTDLIPLRVPCNASVASDPTVQVLGTPEGTNVGLLGILNGFVDNVRIYADYDSNQDLIGFSHS